MQKSPQGAAIIEKSIPVNTSTWVSAVISRNENAKNKGKVNNLVQQFYQKNGGVYEGARKMDLKRKEIITDIKTVLYLTHRAIL